MRISATLKTCQINKYERGIPDDDAFNFIYLLEQGVSIDALIELINPRHKKASAIKMLCRNKYLRNNPLFCFLAGVRQIPLKDNS